jgi:hypothetical protein
LPDNLKKLLLPFALVLALQARELAAQTALENAVRHLDQANARGYTQPLADLFAATLASGWFHSANLRRPGTHVGLELIGTASSVRDADKKFRAVAPPGFDSESFETATVVGSVGSEIEGPNGTAYRSSDGVVDADYLPSVVPQIRIASRDSELIFRFMSTSLIDPLPDGRFPRTTIYGVALRHSISRYIPDFPADLAAALALRGLSMGSRETTRMSQLGIGAGIQGSRDFGRSTIFAGLASDVGHMTVDYTSTAPGDERAISIRIPTKVTLRATAGAGLDFRTTRLFAEAQLGPIVSFAAGVRFGF